MKIVLFLIAFIVLLKLAYTDNTYHYILERDCGTTVKLTDTINGVTGVIYVRKTNGSGYTNYGKTVEPIGMNIDIGTYSILKENCELFTAIFDQCSIAGTYGSSSSKVYFSPYPELTSSLNIFRPRIYLGEKSKVQNGKYILEDGWKTYNTLKNKLTPSYTLQVKCKNN